MPIKTGVVHQPAIIGQSYEETVKFYTEVLVLEWPNLDEPRMTHLFFDAGNGGFPAYFTINLGPSLITELQGSRPGSGCVDCDSSQLAVRADCIDLHLLSEAE